MTYLFSILGRGARPDLRASRNDRFFGSSTFSGQLTPPAADSQLSEFDRIDFNGNNGWTKGHGADSSLRIMRDMDARGELDKDLLLGYMLAKGHGGTRIKRLSSLVDKVRP